MNTPTNIPGVREDRKTGQFFPTLNGKDLSPSSFTEDYALKIAKRAAITNKDTPTKPLAQRITQGKVSKKGNCIDSNNGIRIALSLNTPGWDANAELICETFNVTHETGKTPRELVAAFKEINDIIFGPLGAPGGSNQYHKIREICCSIIFPK